MSAWEETDVSLSHDQAAELGSLDFVDVAARPGSDDWHLRSDSRIGVAIGSGWELWVRPRIEIARLMFLLSYARDPSGWSQTAAGLEEEAELFGAIAAAFSAHALRALEQGILQGYRHLRERLPTLRGRIAFEQQIGRAGGLWHPLSVSYDEYTADVIENQLLKSAATVLRRLPRIGPLLRNRLRRVEVLLSEVSLVPRPREVAAPHLTRLNRRYGPAMKLAELILHSTSIDFMRGPVVGTTFVFDMNEIFQDFVSAAVGEELTRYGGVIRLEPTQASLDSAGRLKLLPDITWWMFGRCMAVLDAKYKALALRGMPNADAYQMLAYCVGLKLREGYLLYAKDEGQGSADHDVVDGRTTIRVRTLDLQLVPEELLGRVRELAREVAARVYDHTAAVLLS
jgi:5-methylcytosine-specific restriction enzyme subunit McrC